MNSYGLGRCKPITITATDGEVTATGKFVAILADGGSATLKASGRRGEDFDFATGGSYATGTARTIPYESYRCGDWDKITVSSGTVIAYVLPIVDNLSW